MTQLAVRFSGMPLKVIIGAIRIVEGFTMVLTFGAWCPYWELKFLVWNVPALYKRGQERKSDESQRPD